MFLDNLRFSNVGGTCEASVDRTPPTVGLTIDTSSGFPTFSGTAGFGATDSKQVTVQVYPQAGGTPTEIVSTGVDATDGSWQAASGPLPPGNYSAQAHQTDLAGNVGTTSSIGFTVAEDSTPPVPIIESPGPGAVSLVDTPTISGVSGIDAGDLPDVTVQVFKGSAVGGAIADEVVTTANDGDWSTDVGPLANGTYTVQAAAVGPERQRGAERPGHVHRRRPAEAHADAHPHARDSDSDAEPDAHPAARARRDGGGRPGQRHHQGQGPEREVPHAGRQ